MRRTRGWGWGLAGVLAAGPAFGQFAADRDPAPAATPAPAPTVTPASFTAPATVPTDRAAPPFAPQAAAPAEAPHPWAVAPGHGEWFVCVKAYSGPDSRQLAEELAAYIRDTHKAAAYLFERGAEERKKEADRQNVVREKLKEQYAPFLELREQMRVKAAAEGREFDDTPVKIRVPKVEYPVQWAVLVGGFKDMDTAAKAKDVIRGWASPQHKPHLLDRAVISGGSSAEGAYINPFATALVVPNPTVRRAAQQQVDPLLAKLNENEDLSLLKTTKPVTLLVKSFSVPARTVTKDADPTAVERLFGAKPGSMLDATAMQAKTLAAALRHQDMKDKYGKPCQFESYVLHVRTGSLVCVGQYESGEDPELARARDALMGLTFQVLDANKRPTGQYERMFDNVFPIVIPRAK